MPYSNIAAAPDPVQKLPKGAQDIWLAAFNAAFEQHKDEDGVDAKAFAIAWSAVRATWEETADGHWRLKAEAKTEAEAEPKVGRRNRAEDEGTIRHIRHSAKGIVDATFTLGVADEPAPEPASREPQAQDVSANAKSAATASVDGVDAVDAVDGDDGAGETEAEAKRDMAANVGGGVDRDKLQDGDFVFADSRTFPVVTPGDVEDAVSSWGRYQGPHTFAEFKRRLTALCHRKGPEFVAKLPEAWKNEQQPKSIEFHLTLSKAFGESGDSDTLIVEGYANTNVVDRTRDHIFPEAFRKGLAAYMRNPVVLWHHDVTKPIGKVLSAVIDEAGLKVRVAIDKSLTWGREAAKLIERGIVNAFSVRAVDDLAEGWVDATGVRNITNWDLREISVVSVPAHHTALFSIAKALATGTDLDAALDGASKDGGTDMAEENMAPVVNTAPPIDEDALIDKAIQRMEAKQKAEQDKATAEVAQKATWEAALRQKWDAEQQAAAAKHLPPFPVVDPDSTHPQGQAADQMRSLGRLIVGSKYDRLGDLDLVMRYYMQLQASRAGRAPRPSDRFYQALMARAAKFMRAEDELPLWEPYAGARPQKRLVPAFDPAVVTPFVSGEEDRGDVVVDGKAVAHNVRFDENVTAQGVAQLLEIGAKNDELIYSTQSGYGDQWVPTLMTAMIWRTIRANAAVLPLFDQFDMPSQPYDYPSEGSDPTFYTVAETTNEAQLAIPTGPFTDSKVGTAKVTFTAGKLGAISYWSEEMNEDSIVAMEPQMRNQYGVSLAHAIDRLLISGDKAGAAGTSSNISYYGAVESAAAWYATLNGLRHEPLVTTAADSRDAGALTIDDVAATRALMGTAGRYGSDPSQLAIICDVATAMKLSMMAEVLTVDKFGAQATILTGQLGSVFGIPIVASQDFDLTNSAGMIHYNTGNTCGSFLVVNRLGWKVGWRRHPRIFVGQIPFSDAWYIMATARLDIEPFSVGMAGLSFNITI